MWTAHLVLKTVKFCNILSKTDYLTAPDSKITYKSILAYISHANQNILDFIVEHESDIEN